MAAFLTKVPDSPESPTRPLEKATMTVKTDAQDSKVLLIPTPTDDPRDPLNWPLSRKFLVCFALCFALFAGFSAPFNGQIQLVQQAKLYGKTTVEITYFVSTTRLSSKDQRLTCTRSEFSGVRGSALGLLVLVACIQEDWPICNDPMVITSHPILDYTCRILHRV